jgi:hypothetical protein
MADEIIEPEVKETPEEEKELPESSQETEFEESEEETEEEEQLETEPIPEPVKTEVKPDDGLALIEGETPREHALRLEVKRLRDDKTRERSKEIFEAPKSEPQTKIESEVLKKYKPEEIQSLREVLPELAKEMGYVRKDELAASTYEEKAQEQIDTFITAHPEYSPEKDPEGLLWGKLKQEYNSVYKPPTNPKDFKKIFERIHKDLFGLQATGALPKVAAANEKVKVASHTGASTPNRLNRSSRVMSGLRTDMLKGFSEQEIADIEAKAE